MLEQENEFMKRKLRIVSEYCEMTTKFAGQFGGGGMGSMMMSGFPPFVKFLCDLRYSKAHVLDKIDELLDDHRNFTQNPPSDTAEGMTTLMGIITKTIEVMKLMSEEG